MGLFVLVIWCLCGWIGSKIGARKTCGSTAGFFWGFLLGIIGLLIVSLWTDAE